MSSRLPRRLLLAVAACCAALLVPRMALAAGAACQTMIPCQSDADCGSGTRCVSGAVTTCVPTSDGGQSCAPASVCLITYEVTCSTDSNCGDGFTCNLSGQGCNCSGSTEDVPDGAVSTPCSEVQKPPIPSCPADAGCPSFPSICDGGSCLCWPEGTCMQTTTTACTSASQCLAGWSCTSGTCEPPCYGDGTFNGPSGSSASGSSSSGSGAASSAGSSHGGCALGTDGASNAGPWAVLALGVALALGRGRRRLTRSGPRSAPPPSSPAT
jgi:MYXO-CTERM domain-containing protein